MSSRLAAILAANICAFLALLYAAGVIPPVAARTAEPMLLIAHRGDMARHPENTIEAFLAAAAREADGIEMDAWLSRSGTWWVVHDPTVDRTTSGSGLVAELSDTDMARLTIDGGIGYAAGRADGANVPRLNDALNALTGYGGLIYVHLKDPSSNHARELAMFLVASDRVSSITVIAPSEEAAALVQEAGPGLRTIVLQDGLNVPADTSHVDGWLTSVGRVTRPAMVSQRTYPVEVYASAIHGAWDESASLRRANRFNVRAFITNDLERAQRVLAGSDI